MSGAGLVCQYKPSLYIIMSHYCIVIGGRNGRLIGKCFSFG